MERKLLQPRRSEKLRNDDKKYITFDFFINPFKAELSKATNTYAIKSKMRSNNIHHITIRKIHVVKLKFRSSVLIIYIHTWYTTNQSELLLKMLV